MNDPWAFQRWAYDTPTGSVARKAMLGALAVMTDTNTGRCEAKQETLAQQTELSVRGVRKVLRDLEDGGLIARRRQYRADGKRRGDEFLLLAPWVDAWPDGLPARNGLAARGAAGTTGTSAQLLPARNDPARTTTSRNGHADSLRSSARQQRARAGAGDIPAEFPDELRPHARTITKVLRQLAARTPNAKAINTMALGNVILARPYKPLVRAVYDYAAWVESNSGRHKDLVSGYRNWLDRTDDLASYEALTEDGRPVSGAVSGRGPYQRPKRTMKEERMEEAREAARVAAERIQKGEVG